MKSKEGKGDDMKEIALRAGNGMKEIAALMAKLPPPDMWPPEMQAQTAQFAALLDTAQKAIAMKAISGIDWQKERGTFLNDAKSPHTRRAYSAALDRLEAWASRENINPLELNAITADQFIRELKARGKAPATARRDIAAISAFYTWLERYHSVIKNPVKGTNIRPLKENKKDTVIPTAADYKTIIDELPPVERAMVIVMATRGLRAGALPTLELKGGKYHGKSKGKRLEENGTAGITLPQEALDAIQAALLDLKKPFAWETRQRTKNNANAIEGRINYYIGKLYKVGAICAPYSCHDFRHYFAKSEYEKNHDIYRLSKLLNHSSVAVTQLYLKSLDVKL